jgi:hypothetical protein
MRNFFVGILLLPVAGCSAADSGETTPEVVSPRLQEAIENYDQLLREKKPEVAFSSGDVATDCREYLEYAQQSSLVETSQNMVAAHDYVACRSAAAVKTSMDNKVSVNDIDVAEALAERVDIRSFPSSMYQQTEDDAFTLAAMPFEVLNTSAHSVQVDREDWQYELRVVARLDLDGNGNEDWLIWLTDKALTGSYNIVQPLVAYDISEGLIELAPLP